MECVILFRNPYSDAVGAISDSGYSMEIATFPSMDAAVEFAANSSLLQAWPYQIVELDEL